MIRAATALLAAAVASGAPAGEFIIGGDVTSHLRVEKHGGVFREDGKVKDGLKILRGNGFNCARIRFFVEPDGLWGAREDLAYAVRLAKRARAEGFKILLDLHCSDTWTNPGTQSKPKKWENLACPDLVAAMREYGREVATEFKRAGIVPELVQVGNEIDGGILWPEGKVWGEGAGGWKQFAELISAAQEGFRAALGDGAAVKFVHHIADPAKGEWHFGELFKQDAKVRVDCLGFSYYPWWQGDLKGLRGNLRKLAEQHGRDVLIVETAHGWTTTYMDSWNNLYWPKKHGQVDFPPTKQGQRDFVRALLEIVRGIPAGRGAGVLWWEPAWLGAREARDYRPGELRNHDGRGRELPAHGSPVDNICLFDFGGNALPALREFRK